MTLLAWPRRPLIFLAALLAAAVVTASRAEAVPDECAADLDAPPSVYLGGWIPAAFDDPRRPREAEPYGRFQAVAGKHVAVVLRWEHWGLNGRIDPEWLRRVAQAGALPLITWDPWNPDISPPDFQQGYLLRDVAAGAHDPYIRAVAADVASYDGPLFIRFAQEMNGTWYPWGKHQNSPEDYIAAWRHVHRVFEEQGAGHVTWVWNVSEKNHPESLRLWYPGDDVVDWVAVDGYNWDDPAYWQGGGTTWRMLDMIFTPSFADIDTFVPPEKPRMIAETASTERAGDPSMKASWICDAFRRALPGALPRVRAVLWFDEQKSEADKPFYWPIETTEASQGAFAAAVAPSYYLGEPSDLPARIGRDKIPDPRALPR